MFTIALLIASLSPAAAPPQTVEKPSLTGAWTMNKDASDAPLTRTRDQDAEGQGGGRHGGSGGGRGYGGGRGGYGGGMGRGGMQGQPRMSPDEMARMREAVRDLIDPSDHLTITQTDSMIVVTGADGRTTRLSPDGKKIKDENTGVERKTKWDAGKLVSEVNGLNQGKATQTFALDPETHQLRITVQMEGRGSQGNRPRTITHVYDFDKQ
jgi:hypothetical protein